MCHTSCVTLRQVFRRFQAFSGVFRRFQAFFGGFRPLSSALTRRWPQRRGHAITQRHGPTLTSPRWQCGGARGGTGVGWPKLAPAAGMAGDGREGQDLAGNGREMPAGCQPRGRAPKLTSRGDGAARDCRRNHLGHRIAPRKTPRDARLQVLLERGAQLHQVIGVLPHLALARVRPPPVLPPRLQDPRIRARLPRIIWRVVRGLYRMREEAESIMC